MPLPLLLALAAGAADTKPAYARPQMLVEPGDLAKMKPGRDAVVLDARPRKEYDAGHVPGAVRADVPAWSKVVNAGEGRDRWVERLGKLGIDGKRPVIIYDDDRSRAAARAWWVLRHWGVKDVRVLNGGWKGWLAAGGKPTKEEPAVAAAKPDLTKDPARLATREQLLAELKGGRPGQIVDTRSEAEFCGKAGKAKRTGAIPGARHLEWSDTLDPKTGRFRSAAELAKLFKEAGIDLDRPATTYCQSGGRAAVMAFVIELMRGRPARNYYRSWAEWGNDPDTPIVKPKE